MRFGMPGDADPDLELVVTWVVEVGTVPLPRLTSRDKYTTLDAAPKHEKLVRIDVQLHRFSRLK